MPRSGRATPALVFATVFIDLIGFGIVLPLLPSYAARFGTSTTLIGVLVAADSAMSFLLAPRWGRLSDRFGRRPVLLVGLLGSALSYLCFGLAQSFVVLLASRIISGGLGATVNVAQATLADITPPERRSQAMGLIGAAFGLGFTLGPAIGGIASRFGDAAPGLIASGLAATNFVAALWLLPETRGSGVAVAAPVVVVPGWPAFRRPFVLSFGGTLAFTAMYVAFPLYCQQAFGLARDRVSGFFVLIGLVTIVVQGRLIGPLTRRVGEVRLALGGAACLSAGFAVLPVAARVAWWPWVLGAGVLVLATGFSLLTPSVAAMVSRRSAASAQGRALGLLQSVGAVARIAGPPLAGQVAERGGLTAPFVAAALVAAVAGLLGLREDAPPAGGGEER